jgi:hypothetical protein
VGNGVMLWGGQESEESIRPGKKREKEGKPSVSQSNNRQSMRKKKEIMFLQNKKSDRNKNRQGEIEKVWENKRFG